MQTQQPECIFFPSIDISILFGLYSPGIHQFSMLIEAHAAVGAHKHEIADKSLSMKECDIKYQRKN